MLTNPGRQLLNWARKAALMTEDEFTTEYHSFSATARKQIASFPAINSVGKVRTGTASHNGGLGIIGGNNG